MKHLTLLLLPILTSCSIGSAGSAVAGYSWKAQEADRLSAEGEDKVVERVVERMIYKEMAINSDK